MTPARPGLLRTVSCLVTVVLVATIGACGGSPTAPATDPAISCPASFEVFSEEGQPVAVTYSNPGVSGGTGPYIVTCTPRSGTVLPPGAHPVTCEVADVNGRTASCSFDIRVRKATRLAETRFLAFGDSLTEGVIRETLYELLKDIPNSYPSKLQGLLRARYQAQMPTVLNDGIGGERVVGASRHSPGGIVRLPLSLEANEPDVLLLMEGTNDVQSGEAAMRQAWDGLEDMVREARGRGVKVFLATIPPQRLSAERNNARVIALIPVYNDGVRRIAAREHARLVDVYDQMKDKPFLIGPDDLHLTIEGYEFVARLFYDAILEDLDIP